MRTHDVLVIGAGSGNMVIDDRFADLDVAIIEERKFGGTCVNYGCIPSKMLAYTADIADTVATAGTFDVDADLRGMRWADVRDRVFGRTDGVADSGESAAPSRPTSPCTRDTPVRRTPPAHRDDRR